MCAVGVGGCDLGDFSVFSGLNENFKLYSVKVWMTFSTVLIAVIA
jgi:hypothetical protein